MPKLGDDFDMVLTRWLRESNLARLFRKDLTENPRLHVLLNATATGFVPGPRGRIDAVRVRTGTGAELLARGAKFVVACGTIEASRLMLAAAADSPELSWANNPWVGSSFQDHLDIHAAKVDVLDMKRFGQLFDNIFLRGFKYNPKLVLAPAVQLERGLTNVAGSFIFESSLADHLSNVKIFIRALRNGIVPPNLKSLPTHVMSLLKVWYPLILRYLRDHRAFNPADLGVTLRLHCEQVPTRHSRITLDPEQRDRNGMPLARLDWHVDGREVEAMAEYCARLDARLRELGIARLRIDPLIAARSPDAIDLASDTNHHCGGLRMAETVADGVVDPDLRVHGTINLYVAGASAFPTSSFANPTYTAMALALRLADRLSD